MIPSIPKLNPDVHKEDTVREEIISPILKALGYSISGNHRIERSPRLKHPYIMTGSRRFNLTLIPDYLLVRYSKPFCILDAKSPSENIVEGDSVQQAYGYAIHPEIRVQLFALCNGHQLAIHHVSTENPTMVIPLDNIKGYWYNLNRMIGTDGTQKDLLPEGFQLDYGVFNEKLGLYENKHKERVIQYFQFIHFADLRRVTDDLYVSHTIVNHGGGPDLCMTIVFDSKRYQQLLKVLPIEVSEQLSEAMKRWPYDCAINTPKPIFISLVGVLDEHLYTSTTNQFDMYRPLQVTEVISDSSHLIPNL